MGIKKTLRRAGASVRCDEKVPDKGGGGRCSSKATDKGGVSAEKQGSMLSCNKKSRVIFHVKL